MSTAVLYTVGTSRSTGPTPVRPLPRLRITARGRAVIMVLVAAPIVAASLVLALNGGGAIATDSGASTPLESVTVLSGQSLWQLAEELAPHADPREFITDVLAVNTLASAEVRAGQRLEIPSEYTQ